MLVKWALGSRVIIHWFMMHKCINIPEWVYKKGQKTLKNSWLFFFRRWTSTSWTQECWVFPACTWQSSSPLRSSTATGAVAMMHTASTCCGGMGVWVPESGALFHPVWYGAYGGSTHHMMESTRVSSLVVLCDITICLKLKISIHQCKTNAI